MIIIAHYTSNIGTHSELIAQTALLANGWEVSIPVAPEVYDIVAKHPTTGRWHTIQCKTVVERNDDRDNALVIRARKSNGENYSTADCDLFIGVHGRDVYMIVNRGISEYWMPKNGRGWTLLSTEIGGKVAEVEAV